MINDIHALYEEKRKQYQDYLVEKRVHEQNLASAVENLKKNIADIHTALANTHGELADRIRSILEKYDTDESLTTASSVAGLISELREVSQILEDEIREALA